MSNAQGERVFDPIDDPTRPSAPPFRSLLTLSLKKKGLRIIGELTEMPRAFAGVRVLVRLHRDVRALTGSRVRNVRASAAALGPPVEVKLTGAASNLIKLFDYRTETPCGVVAMPLVTGSAPRRSYSYF